MLANNNSSSYYSYEDEYTDTPVEIDKQNVTLYSLWGVFLILTIPSIIVFSIFYPSMKYPLDSIASTVQNNKTIASMLSPNGLIRVNETDSYNCSERSPSLLSEIKRNILNQSVIKIVTTSFTTNNVEAISKAGNFYFSKKTKSLLTNTTVLYIVGYNDMNDNNGVLLVDMVNKVDDDERAFVFNSSYDMYNWNNGSVLQDDEGNQYVLIGNEQQPFIVDQNGKYCYQMIDIHNNGNILTGCKERTYLESKYFVINQPIRTRLYGYLKYTDFMFMVTSDFSLSTYHCTSE